MKSLLLNGNWKIRWTDGQRGGSPNYIKEPNQTINADLLGLKKEISDDYNDRKWIDAIVPGEIHLDLFREKIIDDPYIKANVLKCRWVEEYIWYYRKVFDAKDAAVSKFANLNFEGLDYAAIVYLNGIEIARHENSFYPLIVNVAGLLKEKDNVLIVRLESGLYTISEKPISHLYSATMSVDNLLHKRMWLRKPQNSTAWDWSQRLLNVGIFKDVFISYSDTVLVDNCQLRCNTKKDLSSATIEIRLFCSNYKSNLTDLILKIKLCEKTYSFNVDINEGIISAKVTIDNPDLWYPIGYGKQNLYEVGIELFHKENQLFNTTKSTGFRHIEIDQSIHSQGGNYYNLIVNGIRVFAKGGNFVPNDMITAAITKERYDKLTDLAIEANFNFLRVWGGGLYEHNDFFEFCDKKGILVWQEFISACATLPYYDEVFAENIHNEAIYNIRRLSHYPSLIVWCGNNEVDVYGIRDFNKQPELPPDTELYFNTLPKLIKLEDPEKFYQPTSPYSFDGSAANNEIVGDQHPWSVGFANKDYRDYRKMVCRFPNEGGFLGPNSMSTIERCLSENQRYIHSFDWDIHDNMLENWEVGTSSDNGVKFWLDLDPNKMILEDAVFALGFIQSEGLTNYIDSFRSKKFTCSSAIFWMYNDCWPCTSSWTIIDYYLKRTPTFYSVKKAFSQIRVIITEENDKIKYLINSDKMQDENLVLRYGLFTVDGKYIIDNELFVTVGKNNCDCFAQINRSDIKDNYAIPFAILLSNNEIISVNRLINDKYFELPLNKSNIEVQVNDGFILLTCDTYVCGVCLEIDDKESNDNMFDIFPLIPYKVTFNGCEPPKVISTINDIIIKYKQ